jgi:hypothetical protein
MNRVTLWLARALLLALALWWLGASRPALAVTSVHPFGVNVRATGPTTVFLTFRALDTGEVPVEAFWCGELQPGLVAANPQLQLPFPVQTTNPCVPGTVFGRLPVAFDRARTSSSAGITNLTDIMAIPASVARRAWQDAEAGANSAFFYVRRFVGPAGERFVIVTCRMSGGGARVPLALTEVRLAFAIDGVQPTILALARDQTPPRAAARIRYNGNGTLRGRWEVVLPGDVEPEAEDLLTEATLPAERRALQRRWTMVERFERALPPTGEVVLPGPDPARVPTGADGAYKLLLRIEVSDDKEGNSDTGGGRIAFAGGVAAFPMPVLRYVVGAAGSAASASFAAPVLLAPAAGRALGRAASDTIEFTWADPAGVAMLRFELKRDEAEGPPNAAAAAQAGQAAAGGVAGEVLSALVKPGAGRYALPPWVVAAERGRALRWRVWALGGDGEELRASDWRAVIWP